MATLKEQIAKTVEALDKAQTVKAATAKVTAAIKGAALAAETARKLAGKKS